MILFVLIPEAVGDEAPAIAGTNAGPAAPPIRGGVVRFESSGEPLEGPRASTPTGDPHAVPEVRVRRVFE